MNEAERMRLVEVRADGGRFVTISPALIEAGERFMAYILAILLMATDGTGVLLPE